MAAEEKWLVHLNLNGNEIRNAVLQPLTVAPDKPTAGRLYYNTIDKVPYIYDGEKWVSLGAQDKNTTYTFEEGEENGTFKVTPSDGSVAQTVIIHGLKAAAYKNVDTEVTQGSENLITSGAVKEAIDKGIAANQAMHYKGTVGSDGTVEQLPDTDVKIGDTYKVITNGEYNSVPAKLGDMFIAISEAPEWSYIPSGDDIGTLSYTGTNPSLIPQGGVCTWTVNHGLGNKFVSCTIIETSTDEQVIANVIYIDTTSLKIEMVSNEEIAEGTYTVLCVG